MKCCYTLLYEQYYDSLKLSENNLRFECKTCGKIKTLNAAKFLKREARLGRVYLIHWNDRSRITQQDKRR